MSAVVLDSNFGNPRVCYGILSSSSTLQAAHTSPRIWHFAGPRSLPKLSLPAGPHVWVWFDASPSGIAPLNLALRSPPASLLPYHHRRKTPHIYTNEEIDRILRRTQQLPSSKGLRARTFTTLFGLLVAAGMRVNEVVGLDRSDVDLDRGILHIRRTKFRKSRYVPVHVTTVAALKQYAEIRDRLFPAPSTPAFFVSERGRRIPATTAQYNFAKVSQQVGL